MIRCVFLFAALMIAPATWAAEAVSSTPALHRAVKKADAGDTVLIAAGAYDVTDLKIRQDLVLHGEGDVVFFSSEPVEKGILNPLPGVSLTVENLTFKGARSPDLNGAGIRNDGADLTIIDCVFDTNENGVLSTGDAHGRIVITGSTFLNSGHGDGYSHGIYVLRAALVHIADSKFIGTRIGHHVKSLGDRTIIENTLFDDRDGRPSYAVDASKGGDVSILSNKIIQAEDASNATIFNYDLTRGGEALGLKIVGNRIVNRRNNAKFLRNATSLTPVIYDNDIVNEARRALQYRESGRISDD